MSLESLLCVCVRMCVCAPTSPYGQRPIGLFAHLAPQGLLQPLGIKHTHTPDVSSLLSSFL